MLGQLQVNDLPVFIVSILHLLLAAVTFIEVKKQQNKTRDEWYIYQFNQQYSMYDINFVVRVSLEQSDIQYPYSLYALLLLQYFYLFQCSLILI